jgi:hypothetical protein
MRVYQQPVETGMAITSRITAGFVAAILQAEPFL